MLGELLATQVLRLRPLLLLPLLSRQHMTAVVM
jgi:hypothetical protein